MRASWKKFFFSAVPDSSRSGMVVLLTAVMLLLSFSLSGAWKNELAPAGRGKIIRLTVNGKSNYRLSGVPGKAADFLKANWKVVSGCDFSADAPLQITLDDQAVGLGADGYKISVDEKLNIVLSASCPDGLLNAVTSFLEEDLSWRYYHKHQKAISPAGIITQAKVVPRSYQPPFYQRIVYSDWAFKSYRVINEKWAEANKLRQLRQSPKYFQHTMIHRFMRRQDFFAAHPEYFAIRNGSRTNFHSGGQFCMTNPEVRKIVARQAIKAISEQPDMEFLTISQADNDDYCECPECAKIVKLEGAPSGLVIHFINAVAAEVAKVYPNVPISTLAYRWSMKPPRHVRPAPNVMIRFMTFNRINTYPFDFIKDTPDYAYINKWAKITQGGVLIWDHMTNFRFYLKPRADLPVLENSIRYFRDKKVKGVMMLANYSNELGSLAAMRTWVTQKLMWNPDWDIKKLAEDYINGFYGEKVAPFILKYNNLLIREWERHHAANKPGSNFTFSAEFGPAAEKLIEQALAAATDPLVIKEVEFEKMCLLWHAIEQGAGAAKSAEEYLAKITELRRLLKKYKVSGISESREGQADSQLDQFEYEIGLIDYIKKRPAGTVIQPAMQSCYAMARKDQTGLERVKDEKSLTGEVLVQRPDGNWYVQWRMRDYPKFVPGKYRIRMRVRAEMNGKKGYAAAFGAQNQSIMKITTIRRINAEELSEKEYRWITGGTVEYKGEQLLIFNLAAANGPVKKLYVDALELIPVK